VCAYTASRVPTGQTQEVRDVFEISGVRVLCSELDEAGVAITMKLGMDLTEHCLGSRDSEEEPLDELLDSFSVTARFFAGPAIVANSKRHISDVHRS
jgi:hypothetical protein